MDFSLFSLEFDRFCKWFSFLFKHSFLLLLFHYLNSSDYFHFILCYLKICFFFQPFFRVLFLFNESRVVQLIQYVIFFPEALFLVLSVVCIWSNHSVIYGSLSFYLIGVEFTSLWSGITMVISPFMPIPLFIFVETNLIIVCTTRISIPHRWTPLF